VGDPDQFWITHVLGDVFPRLPIPDRFDSARIDAILMGKLLIEPVFVRDGPDRADIRFSNLRVGVVLSAAQRFWMSLTHMPVATRTPQSTFPYTVGNVVNLRAEEKVRGIAALRVIAGVADLQFSGVFPRCYEVCDAMSKDHQSGDPDSTVSPDPMPVPVPAAFRFTDVDVFVESFDVLLR
jgi:hypothetical protein